MADETLRAMNRVTIDELDGCNSCGGNRLRLVTDHLQYVLVREKSTREVKTQR